jgi:hypothetical protein
MFQRCLLKQVDNVDLTVYLWSLLVMDNYVRITCHYIGEEWLFRGIILETMEVCVSRTAKNISDLLEDVGRRWNLEGRVVYVTDNVTNMVNSVTHSGRNHICCAAHVLQLSLQNGLKLAPVRELLEKMLHMFGHLCISRQA